VVQRVGVLAWCFIGIVVTLAIVVAALAAVSSIVLPLVFAAVLAVLLRPAVAGLEAHRIPPIVAAGLMVFAMLAIVILVIWAIERGITSQSSAILDQFEASLRELELDEETIAEVEAALTDLQPGILFGFGEAILSVLSTLGGFLAGAVLGVLIFYYLVKDAPSLRRSLVARMPERLRGETDEFVSEANFVIRRYWWGRTVVSAIVALVVGVGALVLDLPLVLSLVMVTFVGGYVPYIGAVAAGGLAVVVALGSQGAGAAIAMLAIVLVANLLVENFVDPLITGRTLRIHPLVVLLVTTVGGVVGGLVGLVLAVPLTIIALRAVRHLPNLLGVRVEEVRRTLRRSADLSADDGTTAEPATPAEP
jgi:predicted PurR-regulated permease PerM